MPISIEPEDLLGITHNAESCKGGLLWRFGAGALRCATGFRFLRGALLLVLPFPRDCARGTGRDRGSVVRVF